MSDMLKHMFELRHRFMTDLHASNPDAHPGSWPLDLTKKADQQFCRDMGLRGVEEMFEALQHLKNWKPHRKTEVSDVDHEEFLEEIVDAFNYFFSLVILAGFDEEDFYKKYLEKDRVIHERLERGY